MTGRVHWNTAGNGALDCLPRGARVTERDVLLVIAALHSLQRALGLDVVAFGGTPCRTAGRVKPGGLGKLWQRSTSCFLVRLEPHVAAC